MSRTCGIIGMSAALMISDIPFNGPVGAVGRLLDGSLIINPTFAEMDKLELSIVVAGTGCRPYGRGRASEVSEKVLLEAIDFAHSEIRKITAVQKELRSLAGRKKTSC